MKTNWRPYVSYKIWSEFDPPVGQEHWHCDMKRGFARARKQDPQVAALLARETTAQRIGLLAQRGVYEFHQDPRMLCRRDAVEKVADILQLSQQLAEVQERVMLILQNYHKHPILSGKKIIKLSRGDEGIPQPIPIRQNNYLFNLFAAIDCIFVEPDGAMHILDFKTGKSEFDRRQGYVYLVAVSCLYPKQKAIASFYNLETGKQSVPISATADTLNAFKIELTLIAQRHQKELRYYRDHPSEFSQIFPPHTDLNCQFCPFTSICKFSLSKVTA